MTAISTTADSRVIGRPPSDRAGLGPIAAYLALCLIWGSTFLAIRIAVTTMPPFTMIGVRSLTAGAILAGVALARGARLPRLKGFGSAAIAGMLMFTGSQAMLSWGEIRLPSGQAAVLACTVSLSTPLVSWLIGASARPSLVASAGLLIGFCGVAVLVRPGAHVADQVACLVVFASALCWAFGSALARRVPAAGSALLGSGMQLLAGSVGCLVIAWLRGEWAQLSLGAISGRSWLALAYLIVVGSLIAFACFGWLVHLWRPEKLSTYALVNPVIALLLGAGLAGEAIGWRELAATVLILGAVALVMFGGRVRKKAVLF